MKNLILILLLVPMFCKAQSPDDHVVYPDTSLVIGTYIHTIDDRGDLSTKVLGVISSPDMNLDRPTEYLNYLNQPKPSMINQTNINYTYNVLQILGLDLDAKEIEMVISAYELILEKGGKADIDSIVKIKHELSKKYTIGKK